MTKILPFEKLSWSWQIVRYSFKSNSIKEFISNIFLIVLVLSFWLLIAVMLGLRAGVSAGLISALFYGFFIVLLFGLHPSEIDRAAVTKIPSNLGIKRSWQYGLSLGLVAGVIFAIPYGLTVGLGIFWFSIPLFGLRTCIQHLTLRLMLYKKGRIPWNYAKFLDFASERLLMKKIGGGYVFFHRMLLEHFAALYPQPLLPNSGEGE
jgi:hypothetical protein